MDLHCGLLSWLCVRCITFISHEPEWNYCMKDVLNTTDNTFLIPEVISLTHNAFGPAGELVCRLAVGSTCDSLLRKIDLWQYWIWKYCTCVRANANEQKPKTDAICWNQCLKVWGGEKQPSNWPINVYVWKETSRSSMNNQKSSKYVVQHLSASSSSSW